MAARHRSSLPRQEIYPPISSNYFSDLFKAWQAESETGWHSFDFEEAHSKNKPEHHEEDRVYWNKQSIWNQSITRPMPACKSEARRNDQGLWAGEGTRGVALGKESSCRSRRAWLILRIRSNCLAFIFSGSKLDYGRQSDSRNHLEMVWTNGHWQKRISPFLRIQQILWKLRWLHCFRGTNIIDVLAIRPERRRKHIHLWIRKGSEIGPWMQAMHAWQRFRLEDRRCRPSWWWWTCAILQPDRRQAPPSYSHLHSRRTPSPFLITRWCLSMQRKQSECYIYPDAMRQDFHLQEY